MSPATRELVALLNARVEEINNYPTTVFPNRRDEILRKSAFLMHRAAEVIEYMNNLIVETGKRNA